MKKQRARRSPLVGKTRAARALWAALSERQRRALTRTNCFMVQGKRGRRYEVGLKNPRGYNPRCMYDDDACLHFLVIRSIGHRLVWSERRRSWWRLMPAGDTPLADIALAAKLYLEADEPEFRRRAKATCGTLIWGDQKW